MLWRSMWELLHLVFLLVYEMQQQLFSSRQFRESRQNKNVDRWNVSCCWGSYWQKQPLQMLYNVFSNISQKFKEEHLCWSLLFMKSKLAALLKGDSSTYFFSVNFVKFSRTSYLKNTSRQRLLCELYFYKIFKGLFRDDYWC